MFEVELMRKTPSDNISGSIKFKASMQLVLHSEFLEINRICIM